MYMGRFVHISNIRIRTSDIFRIF